MPSTSARYSSCAWSLSLTVHNTYSQYAPNTCRVKYGVVQASCSTGGGFQPVATGVYAQGFTEAAGGRKVLLVNKGSNATTVTVRGVTAGSTWTYIDESTQYGPASTVPLASDTWELAPYALGIVRL